jgi:hypothetical protein
MQRHHLRALTGFVVLLALIGCQRAVVLKVTDDNTGSVDKGLEAHPVIEKGTVLTWKYNKQQFYVKFDDGANPCIPNTSGDPNTYSSTASKPFTAKCTVKNTQAGKWFPYTIKPVPDSDVSLPSPPSPPVPSPPSPPVPVLNGHCRGCSADSK